MELIGIAGIPSHKHRGWQVRFAIAASLMLLSGCGPGLVFNSSNFMSPDEMLARASHVFVGVIQKHEFESWPFFRLRTLGADPFDAKYWRILRREVRVEMVLRGVEPRKVINIYEIAWTGGATGDWNSTQDGERALFLVRVENGRYHIVRDWWRCIFPVTSGPHSHLPLDGSHPLWERIALMNWWIEHSNEATQNPYPHFRNNDPGNVLGLWRTVKIERGLARHPSGSVRVLACQALVALSGWGQDECWETLSEQDRTYLTDYYHYRDFANEVVAGRQNLQKLDASWWWTRFTSRDERRLLTTVSNPKRRAELCQMYEHEYPGDRDTGCPANRPPPATIVGERGDLPLVGPWPR
jgi:hypothetical protein